MIMNTNENNEIKIIKTANIIVSGITGSGKSTLINSVFKKNFAATGKGRPITQEIREYQDPTVPVRIWDTVGFEIGTDDDGVPKTVKSIQNIKQTIAEQYTKEQADHIHAIWYCINQGSNKYQPTEASFVKELQSIGVPFIMVITQCTDEDDDFKRQIIEMNKKNNITDIPIIEVLAQDKTFRGGTSVPAFGLDDLVDKTLELLPDFIKSSFIAGQQIDAELKRKECERIIAEYTKKAEDSFAVKIAISNLVYVHNIIKEMSKKISEVFNQVFSEEECSKIIDEVFMFKGALLTFLNFPIMIMTMVQALPLWMKMYWRLSMHPQEVVNFIPHFGNALIVSFEKAWIKKRDDEMMDVDAFVNKELKQQLKRNFSNC